MACWNCLGFDLKFIVYQLLKMNLFFILLASIKFALDLILNDFNQNLFQFVE